MMNSEKKFIKIACLLLLGIFLGPTVCLGGETQYISDVLIVTMRKGPGNNFKIIKNLKTDTRLEVIGEEGRYLLVRTEDGSEGWVKKQYVSPKTPKVQTIANLKREITGLEGKLKRLQDRNVRLETEVANLNLTHERLSKENDVRQKSNTQIMTSTEGQLEQMTQRYNTLLNQSKHVVELTEENEVLLTANNKMNKELEYFQQESAHLKRSGILKWFLAGAGVLVTGFVLGKIGPSKKKYY